MYNWKDTRNYRRFRDENGNVMEAFERSGFTDYSNFFKAFTKAVGVSPKKYASLSVS